MGHKYTLFVAFIVAMMIIAWIVTGCAARDDMSKDEAISIVKLDRAMRT